MEMPMARGSIRSNTIQVTDDDGSVNISVIKGEQQIIPVTLKWFTNLAGATVVARLVEGTNSGGTIPTTVKTGASTQSLVVQTNTNTAITNNIFPNTYTSNTFHLVIGDDLFDAWSPQPTPGDAGKVYGFFDIEVSDSGSGNAQQIYRPVRGIIEVRYAVGG